MISENALFTGFTLRKAQEARILCCITFHFVRERLESLAEVLLSLSQFSVSDISVILVTNESGKIETKILKRLGEEILGPGRVDLQIQDKLQDPKDLTWGHKAIIRDQFLDTDRHSYSHFIYLEDDIRLSFANFCYFIEAYDLVRHFGLLPAFVRAEWSKLLDGLAATDCFWPIYVPVQPHLRLGELVLANLPNPYNPCFILDRELAAQYVKSPYFEKLSSSKVCQWGVAERAAMGLCLEDVPPSFHSRYVIPISVRTGTVLPPAVIRHLCNTYANNERSPLAKVRLDSLFHGASSVLEGGNWWPPLEGSYPTALGELSDRQFVLVTHHDTIVYFDVEKQILRHGPLGLVPINLALEIDGDTGRLVLLRSQRSNDGMVGAEVTPDAIKSAFNIDWVDVDHVGLKRDGRYACAEWGQLISSQFDHLRDWEKFGLIRLDTFAGIDLLQRHSWESRSDHRIVSLRPQPLRFRDRKMSEASAVAAPILPDLIEPRKGLEFGPTEIRLVGRRQQLAFTFDLAGTTELPSGVTITDATGTTFSFSRID